MNGFNLLEKHMTNMYQNHLKYNPNYPQTFTGKERDSETGYSYFGARFYDSDLMTGWLSVDPLADKYPSLSPYAYCGWNPVRLVDPDGKDIEVVSNNDGTYTVKNGQVNKDKNIYIIDKEGKRTGKVLGEMLTNYSFFDDNENVVTGTIIDTKDNSGKEFLEKASQSDINLFEYVFNEKEGGRSGGKIDFKTNGITDNMTKKEKELYPYRGMPLGGCLGIEKKMYMEVLEMLETMQLDIWLDHEVFHGWLQELVLMDIICYRMNVFKLKKKFQLYLKKWDMIMDLQQKEFLES